MRLCNSVKFKWKKKRKAAVACLLSAAILFMTSCFGAETEQESTTVPFVPVTSERELPAGVITVPYTSLDSLNPFYMKALLNSSLSSLIYRSLYVLDGGFTPQAGLAVSEAVNGINVGVTVGDSFVFSDGSPITAEDVAYSFQKASASPLYSQALKNIESCAVSGKFSVSFTLRRADVNVLNILTFPVVKAGTADSADSLPVSAGKYMFQKGELRTNLVGNSKYSGASSKIGTIRLYDVTVSASLMHLLDIGDIDCFFTDLSDGSAQRTYSSVCEVYLNNLVFIGVNGESFPLNTADMRKALSMACDRRSIVENAFLSHARVTDIPFNTSWNETVGLNEYSFSNDNSITAANILMKTLGYGVNGNALTLKLVYTDTGAFIRNTATMLTESFKNINVTLVPTKLDSEAFSEALKSGDYDLYLGEVKLSDNMDLSCFFDDGGSLSFGIDKNAGVREKYEKYVTGEDTLSMFLRSFSESMPFIPLCFRNGQFCYSRSIGGTVEVTEHNLFGTIDRWKI